MNTITINTFSFDELNEKAKERAMNDFYKYHNLECTNEFWETCKAIEKVFPIYINQLDEYSYRNEYRILEIEDEEQYKTKEEYLTSAKYKEPEYALTGTYSDLYFLQALPSNVPLTKEDFEDALSALFKAYSRACEEEQSKEWFQEMSNCNEWYYLENGDFAPNGI